MSFLYRFHSSGRYLGFIVADRPFDRYTNRLGVDLCEDAPPEAEAGAWPFRVDGTWVIQPNPPRPAPPTPTPAPPSEPAP